MNISKQTKSLYLIMISTAIGLFSPFIIKLDINDMLLACVALILNFLFMISFKLGYLHTKENLCKGLGSLLNLLYIYSAFNLQDKFISIFMILTSIGLFNFYAALFFFLDKERKKIKNTDCKNPINDLNMWSKID